MSKKNSNSLYNLENYTFFSSDDFTSDICALVRNSSRAPKTDIESKINQRDRGPEAQNITAKKQSLNTSKR